MTPKLRNFLLSLPERGLRSVTALTSGLVRELGEVTLPLTIRRSQLCRNLVEATLRQEWQALRQDLSRIPPKQLPGKQALQGLWQEIEQEARKQNRTVFQVSSLMAMSAIASVPAKARWLSASSRAAARQTGSAVAAVLLEDYRATLRQIRETGYARYAVRQFRPYLLAAAAQFSPRRQSLTERLLSFSSRRRSRRAATARSPRSLRKKRTASKRIPRSFP